MSATNSSVMHPFIRFCMKQRPRQIGVGTEALLMPSAAERAFEIQVTKIRRRQWRLVVAHHRKWTRRQAGRRHATTTFRGVRRAVRRVARAHRARRAARAPALSSDPDPAQELISQSFSSRPSHDRAEVFFITPQNEIARATTPAISKGAGPWQQRHDPPK